MGGWGRWAGRQGDEFMSTVVVVVWSGLLCSGLKPGLGLGSLVCNL